MSDPHCLIECCHTYLSELTTEAPQIASNSPTVVHSGVDGVEELISELRRAGVSIDVIVVVDDTERIFESAFGTNQFTENKIAITEQYVESLPIEIDGYVFETEFTPVLDRLQAWLPTIDSDELGDPDTWGVDTGESHQQAYLYGQNKRDTAKPKATLKDTRPESEKVEPYTCQAYDAAMSLVKTGICDIDGVFESLPRHSHAITLYNQRFIDSTPHQKSKVIQRIIQNHTDGEPIPHFESTHNPDIDACLSFLGLSDT